MNDFPIDLETDIVVLGSGPGGYAAAFYAADKGKQVTLVEKGERLGGVCLNSGCIPSKALLHATECIRDQEHAIERGIEYPPPKVDLDKLRSWKNSILTKLSGGIQSLAKKRKVDILKGRGFFESSNILRVETKDGQKFVKFNKAVLATGSKPVLPAVFDLGNPRIMTSTEALETEDIPEKLLVVGGGYIGMELGTVYASLGSKVVLIEALGRLLTGADSDLIKPVVKFAKDNFEELRLNTSVISMATKGKQIQVVSKTGDDEKTELFDRVLISVGRIPNSQDIGLDHTKVQLDEKGFVIVDEGQSTDDPNIYAIGDIAGGTLLAHKAAREARVAIDTILGESNSCKNRIIPAVVFTDPEIAWCGITEEEAKNADLNVKVVRFPWGASGRALTLDRTDGVTKLIVDAKSERVLGVGICGKGAGDLIAEGVLALEMGATAFDLAESIHPHPTLSETIMEAAETFYGHSSHMKT